VEHERRLSAVEMDARELSRPYGTAVEPGAPRRGGGE